MAMWHVTLLIFMEPMSSDIDYPNNDRSRAAGFRRAILRGLGVVLPLLLTIVVLIWAWSMIETYVLRPIESLARHGIVWVISDIHSEVPADVPPSTDGTRRLDGFTYKGKRFVPDPTGRRFFPREVQKLVDEEMDYFGPFESAPASANAYYHRYVQLYMPRRWVVPVFLVVFTTVLYFLGRLFTLGLGRWLVHRFDRTILRIPVVNKVYGGVKQVTDFALSEREIEFNRVVAIQYPRKGVWSLGFVTGNSMREISEATGEPMLSVLMPTSPMPMTGFTVTVKKSEAIDLNLTVDEAIQFVVSCGVVVPPQQRLDPAVNGIARQEVHPPTLAASGDETSGSTPQPQS